MSIAFVTPEQRYDALQQQARREEGTNSSVLLPLPSSHSPQSLTSIPTTHDATAFAGKGLIEEALRTRTQCLALARLCFGKIDVEVSQAHCQLSRSYILCEMYKQAIQHATQVHSSLILCAELCRGLFPRVTASMSHVDVVCVFVRRPSRARRKRATWTCSAQRSP